MVNLTIKMVNLSADFEKLLIQQVAANVIIKSKILEALLITSLRKLDNLRVALFSTKQIT